MPNNYKKNLSSIEKGISTIIRITILLFITLSITGAMQLIQLIDNSQRIQSRIKNEWIKSNPNRAIQFTLYQRNCIFDDRTMVTISLFKHPAKNNLTICAERMGMSEYYYHLANSLNQLTPSFPLNLVITQINVITL
ncbi:hypothetical protein A6E02_18660 [Aliivibrio fischeri]|nr:hypothetical protein A6E02_18660 [Aliivibrio fischeri]